MKRLRVWAVGLALAAIAGCAPRPGESGDVAIFVAASTADAVGDIARQFEAAHEGVSIHINAAATSVLARQLELGGGADIFLAAHPQWADFVEDLNLVEARVPLLGNALVVIVPAASTTEGLAALRMAERVAIADPENVPAGIYAKERLVADQMWDEIGPKAVPAADVRQALFYVEQGECAAGIVYKTDALISTKVRIAYTWASDDFGDIRYPLLLVRGRSAGPLAEKVYTYLQGPEARAIFEKYGFEATAP